MSKSLHRKTQSDDCTKLAESLRISLQFENSILRDADLGRNEWFFQTVAQFIELDNIEAEDDGVFTHKGRQELRDAAKRLRLLAEMFDQFATGIDK